MHPNPAFRQTPEGRSLAFAREAGFGLLCAGTDAAPLISHIPFLLSEDGTTAEFHLVRSNPIARRLSAPLPARLAVSGPHSYVSPDWYGLEDQVPTWNYVAVHLLGRIEAQPQDRLHDLLDRQSAIFEDRLTPKTPWTTAKMTPGVMDRMMRQIMPCVMYLDDVQSTWKLNQNKPDKARLRAADHVAKAGLGTRAKTIAGLMRNPPE